LSHNKGPFTLGSHDLAAFESRYISNLGLLQCSYIDDTQTFFVAGRVYLALIEVPWPCIIDRIIYQVGNFSAGNVRVGLYKEGATLERPDGGELVVESGSVAQLGAHGVQEIAISETYLQPGRYFGALQGSDVSGTFRCLYATNYWVYGIYDNPGGYGPFVDPCPTTSINVVAPLMWLRIKVT